MNADEWSQEGAEVTNMPKDQRIRLLEFSLGSYLLTLFFGTDYADFTGQSPQSPRRKKGRRTGGKEGRDVWVVVREWRTGGGLSRENMPI